MNMGPHHIQARKRLHNNLETYPHPNLFKRWFDYLMYAVGILAPLALVPQVADVFSSHSVTGLSLPTWLLLACINLMWFLYGLLHREYPIVLANIGMAALNASVVVGIILYR